MVGFEPEDWYSLISIAASSIALLVSAYVVRKIPNRRAGDTFVIAMVFFVLAGFFAYFLRTSTIDPYGVNTEVLGIARLFYFFHMLAVGFTAAFIGQYFLGFEIMRRRLVNLFLQISLLVVAIGVTTQVTQLYYIDPYGVVVFDRNAILALATFATIFMTTALGVLIRTLVKNKDPIVRKQTLLMTAGILIHGAGAETYAFARIGLRLYPPPFLTITALAMATLFAVAVLRYKMFVVTPRGEQAVALPRRFDLKPGRAYAIRERRPKLVFLALSEAVRSGSMGLVITRRSPTEIREDYDLEATPVLWLTSTFGRNHVPPTDPDLLERLAKEFLTAQPKGIVALEGIEFLADYLPADRVVRFVHVLRDLVTAGGGILVVSSDPAALDERVAAVLDREYEPLALPVKTGFSVDDVFVIEGSGLLLTHAARGEAADIDADVMAGMLTAIMNFARTSFATGSDELRRLELGEKTVVIERSPRFILAIAVSGTTPTDIRDEMRTFLERAERRYGPVMAQWTGDIAAFPGLHAMTNRLFL